MNWIKYELHINKMTAYLDTALTVRLLIYMECNFIPFKDSKCPISFLSFISFLLV